jgi:hypothetical protein
MADETTEKKLSIKEGVGCFILGVIFIGVLFFYKKLANKEEDTKKAAAEKVRKTLDDMARMRAYYHL